MQISITTPVVSALKNCYVRGFLEVPSDILYHFWIQVAVFASETAEVKRSLCDRSKIETVINL